MKNMVQIFIFTEDGCNADDGEYSMHLGGFLGSLDLCAVGGVDDISLIKDCIINNLDFAKLPNEGTTEVRLKESGEWEDVFWHKYYEIISIEIQE